MMQPYFVPDLVPDCVPGAASGQPIEFVPLPAAPYFVPHDRAHRAQRALQTIHAIADAACDGRPIDALVEIRRLAREAVR